MKNTERARLSKSHRTQCPSGLANSSIVTMIGLCGFGIVITLIGFAVVLIRQPNKNPEIVTDLLIGAIVTIMLGIIGSVARVSLTNLF